MLKCYEVSYHVKDKQEKSNYNKEIPVPKLGHCHTNIEISIEGIVKLFVDTHQRNDVRMDVS